VIIASTTVPFVNGGGRLIVEWTAQALREAGHEVEELYLPFPTDPRAVLPAIVGLRALPLADACDRLVAIRWPAHVLRHPSKATWFIHHYRELFDLWDSPYRALPANAEGIAYREAMRRVDNLALAESADLFTNSLIVRDRVREFNGLEAEPLFPPLGGDTGRFRTDSYGDFVFYPSRITPIKRQMLAVSAMRYTRTPVRLVVAGSPDQAQFGVDLQRYVREHGLQGKVDLRLGWLSEADKVDLLASCLALAYLPVNEDSYGYPSLEASHSAKAVLTVTDSGGALEFVQDGVQGLVTDPTPQALAAAFDRLYEDRDLARRMGEASRARRAELHIEWPHVVRRLLGEADA
jgi:glycosyltransferase involved in cell wall biosynthesis